MPQPAYNPAFPTGLGYEIMTFGGGAAPAASPLPGGSSGGVQVTQGPAAPPGPKPEQVHPDEFAKANKLRPIPNPEGVKQAIKRGEIKDKRFSLIQDIFLRNQAMEGEIRKNKPQGQWKTFFKPGFITGNPKFAPSKKNPFGKAHPGAAPMGAGKRLAKKHGLVFQDL